MVKAHGEQRLLRVPSINSSETVTGNIFMGRLKKKLKKKLRIMKKPIPI